MKRPAVLARFFAIVMLATVASAQKYRVTDLGVLGGNISNATSINDSGQVVGLSGHERPSATF